MVCQLQGDGPPLPLHCVSRVTRMYREDDWLEDDAESAASGGDRCLCSGWPDYICTVGYSQESLLYGTSLPLKHDRVVFVTTLPWDSSHG